MKVVAILLLVAAVASAADYPNPPVYKPNDYKPAPHKYEEPAYPPAHYEFEWESSADPDTTYRHKEARKGDDTKGDFSSNGPTGSASVDYSVNGYSGFVAKSQFEIKGDYAKPYDYKPKY